MSARLAAVKRDGVPSSVRNALRGPAEPLDRDTRKWMESRFHFDFGHIRVHRDSRAAEAASDIDAVAFTAGRDVVFGQGRFAPHTPIGRATLAHELAHSSPVSHDPNKLTLGGTHDVEETHADHAAIAALNPSMAPPRAPANSGEPIVRRGWLGSAITWGIIGGIAGAIAGALIPGVGALLGAGIGLLAGAILGGIFGRERPIMHLETARDTDLCSDPSDPTTVIQRLPAGTRLVPAAAGAATHPGWMFVRVSTGPQIGLTGWVKSVDVVSRGLTEILTMQQAQELFTELAAGTFMQPGVGETAIPFFYTLDGCWARAQRMAEMLTEKGYFSQKMFVASRVRIDGGIPRLGLRPPTQFGADPQHKAETGPGASWVYHVAPLLRVRLTSGEVVRMVIDPSTMSGPVRFEEWIRNMNYRGQEFRETGMSDLRRDLADPSWTGAQYAITSRSQLTPEAELGDESAWFETTATLTRYSGPQYGGATKLAAALRGHLQAHAPLATVLSTIAAAHPDSRTVIRTSPNFNVLRQALTTEYGSVVNTALASTAPPAGGTP